MIKPLQAIANRTMMSSPFKKANDFSSYQRTASYAPLGEKLDIKCTNERQLTKSCGQKLDILG